MEKVVGLGISFVIGAAVYAVVAPRVRRFVRRLWAKRERKKQ